TGFRDNVECIVALADDKSDEFHQHSMDMEFIAAARSLVPALAQALAAQMAENERLAQFIEVCRDEERRAMNAALAESERIKDLDRRVAGAEREPSIKERTRQRESHLNAAFTPIGDAPLPYNPDERRVCDYLQEITKGAIGCGADPIGFLVATHRVIAADKADAERDQARGVLRDLLPPEKYDAALAAAQKQEDGWRP